MNSYEQRGLLQWNLSTGDVNASSLVVILHGMDCSPQSVLRLTESVENVRVDADASACRILIPQLPLRWNQCVDLRLLAEEIAAYLDQATSDIKIQDFTLIGHSAGGVIAQAVYLALEQLESQLAGKKTTRLVLLAPLNRGWAISHHIPPSKKIAWMIGIAIRPFICIFEYLISLGRRPYEQPWISQLERGSPFLVWLRLNWLELKQISPRNIPQVAQLLGSSDEIVSWQDMVDTAIGKSFVYLDVPFSDHVTLLDFDNREHGSIRQKCFESALTAELDFAGIKPWDTDPTTPDKDVTRVVFVIHGIRDAGHWTQKIGLEARRIFEQNNTGHAPNKLAIVTSSYGYFSLLEFLRYSKRNEKVKWLAEQYVEARRRYPNAKFSFIGHSNGTYLLAHALNIYPEILNFDRIAFIGSVVSSNFGWNKILQTRRQAVIPAEKTSNIGIPNSELSILNITATADYVVGLLPMVAEVFRLDRIFKSDIGAAGVLGFGQNNLGTKNHRIGGHSAAIQEENWEHLAKFAVLGVLPSTKTDQDPETYSILRTFFLRPPIVKFSCIISIMIALFLLLYLLPWFAWSYPLLFWGVPIGLGVAGVLVTAGIETHLLQMPISERLEKRKWAALTLKLTATSVCLFYVICSIFFWNQDVLGVASGIEYTPESTSALTSSTALATTAAAEWVRTLSVCAYILTTYSVLTRV